MFSLSWFTTIPGILITVGILLLVAALIVFIVTSKKNKNKESASAEGNSNMQVAPAPSIVNNQSTPNMQPNNNLYGQMPNQGGTPTINNIGMPTNNPVNVGTTSQIDVNAPSPYSTTPAFSSNSINMPLENENQNINPMPISDNGNLNNYQQPMDIPSIQPSPSVTTIENQNSNIEASQESFMGIPAIPQVDNSINQPINEPISINTNDVVANINNVVEPTVQTIPEVPTITQNNASVGIDDTVNTIPTIDQVVPEMQDNLQSINEAVVPNIQDSFTPTQTPIYGGVSPVVPEPKVEVPHQIYGGANPLENTQSVPISQIANDINPNTGYAQPTVENMEVSDNYKINVPETPAINPQIQQNNDPIYNQIPNNNQAGMYNTGNNSTPNIPPVHSEIPANNNIPINNNMVYQSVAPNQQMPVSANQNVQ